MMKNQTYNRLKWLATVFLPAFATLVGTVGLSISWPYTELAVLILTAIDTFLGSLLGFSTSQYNKQVRNRINPYEVDNEFTLPTDFPEEEQDNEN